jgi:NAD+ diphosphatase
MKLAETVTFGGSGLNRAAELRRDAGQVAALWSHAKVLLIWRGRPLTAGEALVWLPTDHPLVGQVQTALFLGFDGEDPVFAQDFSAWTPVEPTAQQAGFFDTSIQALRGR